MKASLLFTLVITTLLLRGQEIDKLTIQKCYAEGLNILEKIKKQDTTELSGFIEAKTFKTLFNLSNNNSLSINTDIYYDYRIDNFVFTIFAGNSINDSTDWGLYDYKFITTVQLNYENKVFKIISITNIFEDNELKKRWWQSLMDTYKNKQFLRNEWAEKFGLIPPPPPPPENKSWFNK